MIFLVVIPKEGLAGTSPAKPSFRITLTIQYNLGRQQNMILNVQSGPYSRCYTGTKRRRFGWVGASQEFF